MNILKKIAPEWLRKKIEQQPDDVDTEAGIVDDVRLVEIMKQLIEKDGDKHE